MKVKIGELAKLTDCQVVTIRYYEREGLLPRPERSGGNYRLYGEEDMERLRFIRHCRLHGMTLAEIRELLSFRDNPAVSCEWINTLVGRHIAEVEKQIASLNHLKTHLEALIRQCDGNRGGHCGILKSLSEGESCPVCGGRSCALLHGASAESVSAEPASAEPAPSGRRRPR